MICGFTIITSGFEFSVHTGGNMAQESHSQVSQVSRNRRFATAVFCERQTVRQKVLLPPWVKLRNTQHERMSSALPPKNRRWFSCPKKLRGSDVTGRNRPLADLASAPSDRGSRLKNTTDTAANRCRCTPVSTALTLVTPILSSADIISAKRSTMLACGISRALSTHAKRTKEANTFSGS